MRQLVKHSKSAQSAPIQGKAGTLPKPVKQFSRMRYSKCGLFLGFVFE